MNLYYQNVTMSDLFTIIFIDGVYRRGQEYYDQIFNVLKKINKNNIYQEIENCKILYNITLKDYEIVSLIILGEYFIYVGSNISMIIFINIENLTLTHVCAACMEKRASEYLKYWIKYRNIFMSSNEYISNLDNDEYIISINRVMASYYRDDIKEVIKYLNLIHNILGIECNILYTKCEPKKQKNKPKIHNLFNFNPQEIIHHYDINDFILKLSMLYYECCLPFELVVIIFNYID